MDNLFQKREIVTHAIESAPGLGGTYLTERRCQLTVLTGSRAGQVFEIQGSPFRVGKGPESDLQLPDPTVSREHFHLIQEGGSFLIRDLGSTNGTWIDQMRIREAFLRLGAVIKAGDVQLRFDPLFKPLEVVPSESSTFGTLVGKSLAMRQIFSLLGRIGKTDATVIILGETGTGKGAVARAIHEASPRKNGPFVVVDCGAIAENLIESELFGHERGAFTGATNQRRGALEQASGGTLFIDELVDLRIDLQPKLLRALEEREFRRLGSNQPLKLDARVIAATRRDLWSEVQAGNFREDLYFRLAVFTIPLPPLRERLEDISALVQRFADELHVDDEAKARINKKLIAHLQGHDWPGNVRELRNAVERVLYFGEDQVDPLAGPLASAAPPGPSGPPASGKHAAVTAAPRSRPAPVDMEAKTQPEAGLQDVMTAPEDAAATDPQARDLAHSIDYELPFKVAKERLLEQFEAEYLRRLLDRCHWQISQAAREAEIDRKHLYNLMKKYGIEPEGQKGS